MMPEHLLSAVHRPVGVIEPAHERARRAVKAIAEGRFDDALANIAALPEECTEPRVWKAILAGDVAEVRKNFATAIAHYEHALAECLVDLVPDPRTGSRDDPRAAPGDSQLSDLRRLAAIVLARLGRLHRRQDHPAAAYRAHVAAYSLLETAGSFEELCDAALEVGLTLSFLGAAPAGPSPADGPASLPGTPMPTSLPHDWFRVAIDLAKHCRLDSSRRGATAWQRLAHFLTAAGRHDEAVSAAQNARELWQQHDLAAVATARADMHLGRALLNLGKSLFESSPARAADALDEAVLKLSTARDSLLAFGSEAAEDATCCGQLCDFAQRLRQSV